MRMRRLGKREGWGCSEKGTRGQWRRAGHEVRRMTCQLTTCTATSTTDRMDGHPASADDRSDKGRL
jgi:hypothetical protein